MRRFVEDGFKPAPSVLHQQVDFLWKEQRLTVHSDHRTPLYETVHEIVDYDCYQLSRCSFPSRANGLILDIGGNVGVAALVLASGYAGHVVSLEPIEENITFLQENLHANAVNNVEVIQAALTQNDGQIDLWMDPAQSVSAHQRTNEPPSWLNSGLTRKTVPALSLASLLARYGDRPVDLLKADCEGGEYDIIAQFDREIARRVRQVSLEVHDLDRTRCLRTIRQQLQKLGYTVFYKPEMLGRPTLHHLLAVSWDAATP